MSSVERRRILFNRQILHQFLLMSFSLQENFLRVKSSNIRMSKCKSITTSGSFIELKYPMPACVGFESYEGFRSHLKCILGQIRPTPLPLYMYNCSQIYNLFLLSNLWRTTSEEKRELERLQKPIYNSVRRAAEVHRQVKTIPLSNMFAA